MESHTPPRPDQQYRPEVVQIAAPRRRVWPWVLGTAVVLLLLGGIGNLAEQEQATTPSTPIEQPGLTSYEGSTVAEGVDILWAIDGQDTICPLIDQYGLSAARTSFITTDPQLGSDAYEGAVFDEFVQEAC